YPGRGYWVKVSQLGKLVLSTSGNLTAGALVKIVSDDEMPPPPPDGEILDPPEAGKNPKSQIPSRFSLEQNYPNPFNSQTEMDFIIPNREMVRIEVYDVLGRRLKTLMNKVLESGKHSVSFDASGLTSGVYYYSIITASRRITKKMLIIQ
ncbi:MAG: T9SS type A sorting domain-containing protein, partial [Bacteroidota bacterium]|nr:T9SS type A sorting domain-containing protein [Bacteroidota bacterium]